MFHRTKFFFQHYDMLATPSDKGAHVVLLNRSTYIQGMDKLLGDKTYTQFQLPPVENTYTNLKMHLMWALFLLFMVYQRYTKRTLH